jgi:predicted RNA-binding protein YlqC (UPF0109 family)
MESNVENIVPELSVEDLVADIARVLVDMPEKVEVSAKSIEGGTFLQLKVDPLDVGKIIGKQGRTARSIRTLLGAISVKLHHRYSPEIVEDGALPPPSHR